MGLSGKCMCGAVAYESTSDPEATALCHCTDCQKWTGGAFTSNAMVSEDAFKVVKGTPKLFEMKGDSGKNREHNFCGDCGSTLFTRLDAMPGKVFIKAGGLDNGGSHLDNKITLEVYVRDRVPYLQPVAGAEQHHLFGGV